MSFETWPPPQHDPFVSTDYSMVGDPSKNRYRGEIGKGQRVNRRRLLIVVIAIVVVLIGVAATVWALNRSAPNSVDEVAAAAVAAGEDLDADAAIELLCESPTQQQSDGIDSLIADGKRRADTDNPDKYTVADVKGDTSGSFRLTVTSVEGDVITTHLLAQVAVEQDGDRSCIAGAQVLENPAPRRALGLP